MKYRGIQQQIALNNTKSILYLLAFRYPLSALTAARQYAGVQPYRKLVYERRNDNA